MADTVFAVRRLLLIPALFCLAVPAVAVARVGAAGDGTLTIKTGAGRVMVGAKGGVIGRFDEGTMIVTDLNPNDDVDAVVTGFEKKTIRDDFTTVYSGKGIRFRFIGATFKLVLVKSTTGIDLSAVGKGTVELLGAGTEDDGTYSFNGDAPKPLPTSPKGEPKEFSLAST